jgi:hypothetical protein
LEGRAAYIKPSASIMVGNEAGAMKQHEGLNPRKKEPRKLGRYVP